MSQDLHLLTLGRTRCRCLVRNVSAPSTPLLDCEVRCVRSFDLLEEMKVGRAPGWWQSHLRQVHLFLAGAHRLTSFLSIPSHFYIQLSNTFLIASLHSGADSPSLEQP